MKQGKRAFGFIHPLIVLCLLLSGTLTGFAQSPGSIDVTGVVVDESNEPLIGVSIRVDGTSNGTITNIDGEYSIKGISKNAVLIFTYVGMDPLKESVNGRTKINVRLSSNAQMLDEVVAIGYGSVKKSDLTGSVASVKPEAITTTPTNSVEGLLQ